MNEDVLPIENGDFQCHSLVFRGVTIGGGFNLCSQLFCIKNIKSINDVWLVCAGKILYHLVDEKMVPSLNLPNLEIWNLQKSTTMTSLRAHSNATWTISLGFLTPCEEEFGHQKTYLNTFSGGIWKTRV